MGWIAPAERERQQAKQEGGEPENAEARGVVPETGDGDPAVGQQREGERTQVVHHHREQGRGDNQQRAAPRGTHQPRGKKDARVKAREETADAAAGLLDANGSGGEMDEVAMLFCGDTQKMQGLQHVVGDEALQLKSEARVGAERQRGGEHPQPGGGQAGPVQRREVRTARRETQQGGEQSGGEAGGEEEFHQGMAPPHRGGQETRDREERERAGRGQPGGPPEQRGGSQPGHVARSAAFPD